jgi:hypothetical protein
VSCCAVPQAGLVTLEQLLPYVGPADELQRQYKEAFDKLRGDVRMLLQGNLEAEGTHSLILTCSLCCWRHW